MPIPARTRLKYVVFALLPSAALLLGAEGICRLLEIARPGLRSLPLPEERFGVLDPDEDLFWRLRPGVRTSFAGVDGGLAVNRLGLRSDELGPKAAGEFRILSLGESTTFGVGVVNAATYSARLETLLRAARPDLRVRVLNAGVPAWSSFQSLLYLKLHGLALEPDLVLFYHEVNDYLPSSVRGAGNDEIGLTRTDKQLYESVRGSVARRLLAHSALFRCLGAFAARRAIAKLDPGKRVVQPGTIGLPEIGLPPRVVTGSPGASRPARINERALPTRVSPAERTEILAELAAVCREHNVRLVVIHPSYSASRRHECELTEFCRARGIPMLEVYDALHPEGADTPSLFRDSMHPTAEGHDVLARSLARFLQDGAYLPAPR